MQASNNDAFIFFWGGVFSLTLSPWLYVIHQQIKKTKKNKMDMIEFWLFQRSLGKLLKFWRSAPTQFEITDLSN